MSQPTSVRQARRYLVRLLGTLGVLVAALVTITATGYRLGLVEAANHEIYRYQRAKIDAPGRIDIAFVGDSSLGNAIDAETFSALSGAPTANLALNGSYGSGGAFNMTRALLREKSPKLVVVTQSIDTMRRADAFPGFYFSAEPAQLLMTSPIRILELYFSWKTARRVVEQIAKHGVAPRDQAFAGDYIAQTRLPLGDAAALEGAEHALEPSMIAPEQLVYVARIATLCRERGVACVYAHGPIYEEYCEEAQDYIERLTADVESAGLRVIPGTPLCLPAADVGDSIDHVRSGLKQVYTERYFRLLREVVAQSAPR